MIRSPLNYTGGKFRLLPQLVPLFPPQIETFYDLFAGGLNIGINVAADRVVAYEVITPLVELYAYWQSTSTPDVVRDIERIVEQYSLTNVNEKGYLLLRAAYNKSKKPALLFALICFSFNHQIRFNSHLGFNAPFGRNRSQFNSAIRTNLEAFVSKLHEKPVLLKPMSCLDLNLDSVSTTDFLYADPPYLITKAAYNDGKRGFEGWTPSHEMKLLALLAEADSRGIRFALSNVLESKGVENTVLKEWSAKYRVHSVTANYANSSYNTRRGTSQEVLVTNY